MLLQTETSIHPSEKWILSETKYKEGVEPNIQTENLNIESMSNHSTNDSSEKIGTTNKQQQDLKTVGNRPP